MKTFSLVVICALQAFTARGSLKTQMEKGCESDEDYTNIDLIDKWQGKFKALAVFGEGRCLKQRLQISKDSNETITFSDLNSHSDTSKLIYRRVGNHFELNETEPKVSSKQYYFPVLDKTGETMPDLLFVLDCVQFERKEIAFRILMKDKRCGWRCIKAIKATGFKLDVRNCMTG